MRSISFLGLGFVLLAGCASGATDDRTGTDEGASVYGEDTRIKVDDDGTNVPEKYRALLDAFGIMYRDEGGFCTVTHIGKGVVMTAGHCFGAGDEPKKNYEPEETTVRWGVRGMQHATWPYLTSRLTKVLEARRSLPGPDYAFFLVDPVPPVAVKVDLAARPRAGTKLTLFSHPWGRPLEWSGTCELMPPTDHGGSQRFDHRCATESGSSGGAMLDDATLEIVGIHDADNGSDTVVATENEATYVLDTPVRELLEAQP